MASQPIDNHLLARILSEEEPNLDWESLSEEDWTLLVERSQSAGVTPLIHWSLSKSGKISLVPRIERDFLRAAYVSTRMNNRQILGELQDLNRLFRQADIPVVALKGICYALTIYPDIGLRPMCDLDLLVPSSQLATAVHIAYSWGYVDSIPEAVPGLDELLNHAASLKKTGTPFITLEVHRSLVAEGAFTHAVPVDWFWNHTERLDVNYATGKPFHLRMLSPTAQLLYACAHAMLQHGAREVSLRWLYDLDRLIRFYDERLDWDLLLSQARAFEWGSAVSAALRQVQSYFNTSIPQHILDELERQSDRNADRVTAIQDPPATHTLEEYQRLKSLNMLGRLKMLRALILPSPVYMRWRYKLKNSWILPFWYIYRWWGIFVDGVKTSLHLMQNAAAQANHPAKSEQ